MLFQVMLLDIVVASDLASMIDHRGCVVTCLAALATQYPLITLFFT